MNKVGKCLFVCKPCKIAGEYEVETAPPNASIFAEMALREKDDIPCSKCGKKMVRQINAPTANFVGSGWADAGGNSYAFNKQRQEYKESKRVKKEN